MMGAHPWRSRRGKQTRCARDSTAQASGWLIQANCAAIPQELIKSELFGHEKGSFTGATGMKRGKFEVADGGTIFI